MRYIGKWNIELIDMRNLQYLYIHRALLSLICHYANVMVECVCNEP